MGKSPRVHTAEFKARVALAACKGDRTPSAIAAQYQVHVELVQGWKKQMLDGAATVFSRTDKPVSAADLALMARLDRWHTDHPFLGSRKLATLASSPEEAVNRKRVQRLMRRMGLKCLFPRPKCTMTSRCHKKNPYLLKGLKIERPGQVWSADITYVPMPSGFMYLVATIDWYSRLGVAAIAVGEGVEVGQAGSPMTTTLASCSGGPIWSILRRRASS